MEERCKRSDLNSHFSYYYTYTVTIIVLLLLITYHQNSQFISLNNLQQQRYLQESSTVASFNNNGNKNNIDYLELPTLRWMNLLSDGETFLEGNTIRVSPINESILYAISRSGNLFVISAATGLKIQTVSPSPRTLTEDGLTSTWSLYSNSGLAFGSYPLYRGGKESSVDRNNNNDMGGYNEYLHYVLNSGDIQLENNKNTNDRQDYLEFVVYSVIDQPSIDSRFLPKTRVVCVSIPDHTILWTSAGLPGLSNGSPVVYHSLPANMYTDNTGSTVSSSANRYSNTHGAKNNDGGTYIVLTHNSVLVRPDNTSRTTGHITVLEALDGHVKWTQSEWSRDEIPKGYGSPAISRSPTLGGESSGGSRDNPSDVIVYTSSDQEGRGFVGNLFAFQKVSFVDREVDAGINSSNVATAMTYDPFETRVLKRVRWNSIARPVMNRNGTHLYVAVTGNAVRGWSGVAKFNETADWSKRLVPTATGTNVTSYSDDVAIRTSPTLSNDEKRLFVVTVRNETMCLNSRTGERIWSATTRTASSLLAQPKSSPDDKRLYMIMSQDGRVVAIDQRRGEVLWGFSCGAELLPSVCDKTSVLADFDVSNDGQYLYYGDANGRIISLTVGKISNENLPSSSTTLISDNKNNNNNEAQTNFDAYSTDTSNSITEIDRMSSVKKAGLVALSFFLSVLLVGVSAMYVMKSKDFDPVSFFSDLSWSDFRIQRKKLPDDYSSSDGIGRGMLAVENGNYQPDNSIQDGPDIYEDKFLANLSFDDSQNNATIARDTFSTLWVDPTHSKPATSIDDDSQHRAADRMAILLGTSNRITPISENFGYGQAVMM